MTVTTYQLTRLLLARRRHLQLPKFGRRVNSRRKPGKGSTSSRVDLKWASYWLSLNDRLTHAQFPFLMLPLTPPPPPLLFLQHPFPYIPLSTRYRVSHKKVSICIFSIIKTTYNRNFFLIQSTDKVLPLSKMSKSISNLSNSTFKWLCKAILKNIFL